MESATPKVSGNRVTNIITSLDGTYYVLAELFIIFTFFLSAPSYSSAVKFYTLPEYSLLYDYVYALFWLMLFFMFLGVIVLRRNRDDIATKIYIVFRLRRIATIMPALTIFFVAFLAVALFPVDTRIGYFWLNILAKIFYSLLFVAIVLFYFVVYSALLYFLSPGTKQRLQSFGRFLLQRQAALDYSVFSIIKEFRTLPKLSGDGFPFLFSHAHSVISRILFTGFLRFDIKGTDDALTEILLGIRLGETKEQESICDFFEELSELPSRSKLAKVSEADYLLKSISKVRKSLNGVGDIRTQNQVIGIWQSRFAYFVKKHVLGLTLLVGVITAVLIVILKVT